MNQQRADLLNQLYQNASGSIDALTAIIPRITDIRLKSELRNQLETYKGQLHNVKKEMRLLNIFPHETNPFYKTATSLTLSMAMAMQQPESRISKTLIKNMNNSMIDIHKALNSYTDIDYSLKQTATKIIDNQQINMENLKSFL